MDFFPPWSSSCTCSWSKFCFLNPQECSLNSQLDTKTSSRSETKLPELVLWHPRHKALLFKSALLTNTHSLAIQMHFQTKAAAVRDNLERRLASYPTLPICLEKTFKETKWEVSICFPSHDEKVPGEVAMHRGRIPQCWERFHCPYQVGAEEPVLVRSPSLLV